MTFDEAKQLLRKISNDKYCSIQYEESFHRDGGKDTECGLYIKGHNWVTAKSWEEAFRELFITQLEIPEEIFTLAKEGKI